MADPNTPQTAETRSGPVTGRARNGVLLFAGIPYAASTERERRWAPPEMHHGWTGVFDATRFGPAAPQLPGAGLTNSTPVDWSEDCLSLNVVTPAVDDRRRPVYVWIHGGAYQHGQGSTPWYDGSSFASRGDIVTVTINYRLGIFGYTNLAEIAGGHPQSGHVGILDQIAALRWVRDNIEAFGGDPSRVTIGGESAGAFSVANLLGHPDGKGLFTRAILQSGAAHSSLPPAVSSRVAEQVMAEADVDSIEALRKLEPDVLLDVAARVSSAHAQPPRHNALGITTSSPFYPTYDDEVYGHPTLLEAVADHSADVTVLIGTNRDELGLWGLGADIDDEKLERYVSGLTEDVETAIDTYRSEHPGAHNGEIARRIGTDWTFRAPAIALAEARHQSPTYMYHFAWTSRAFDGALGSCHALEIPFTFNTLNARGTDLFLGEGPTPSALAESMHDCWINFIRDGDPTSEATSGWQPYSVACRSVMEFADPQGVIDDPLAETRSFWASRR